MEKIPQTADPQSDLVTIFKNIPRGGASVEHSLVSPETYRLLMRDRPGKFTEKQVGFERDTKAAEHCGDCFHWYVSKVAGRKVCEIFRPADDSNVEPEDSCRYFSADGETFPRLK